MGKHSKTTTDISELQSQISELYSLVGSVRRHLASSRQFGAKALNDMDQKITELSERISERDSDKTEGARVEMPAIPNEYQRAEVLRLASNVNLHPDLIVPMAQKFLAFVSGTEAPSGEEQAARNAKFIVRVKQDFVNDLIADYLGLSYSHTVTVGQVRQVLRRAAGLS